MITLMTGIPGTGKTCHIVMELQKIRDRPVFVMGIPELKLAHIPTPPVSEWTELRASPEDPSVMLPYFTFPPNSIVVIDEAQRIYRPRSAGSKVPDIVAAFETHRHTGIDFWLITQAPALLDSNIRRLITKHWHIHPTPFGRKLLEWSQCRDPESKTDRNDALKADYKPAKTAFELYKSAEVHTVVKRAIPKSLIVAVVCILLAVGLSWYGYQRIKAKVTPSSASGASQSSTGEVRQASSASTSRSEQLAENPQQYMTDFVPRHIDYPESAPAYDAVRVVKSFPVIAGCIKTEKICKCVSQQGTDVQVTPDRCLAILANKVFDPYREPLRPPEVVASLGDVRQQEVQHPAIAAALPGVAPGR